MERVIRHCKERLDLTIADVVCDTRGGTSFGQIQMRATLNASRDCIREIYDGIPCERPVTDIDSYGHGVQNPPAATCHREITMVYLPRLPTSQGAITCFGPQNRSK